MHDDRRVVGEPDVEHQAIVGHAKMQRVRAAVVADRREGILLDQVVDRDRALVLDIEARAPDRFLVERHRDDAIGIGCLARGVIGRLRRIAIERAWASSPSASPSVIAASASAPS